MDKEIGRTTRIGFGVAVNFGGIFAHDVAQPHDQFKKVNEAAHFASGATRNVAPKGFGKDGFILAAFHTADMAGVKRFVAAVFICGVVTVPFAQVSEFVFNGASAVAFEPANKCIKRFACLLFPDAMLHKRKFLGHNIHPNEINS